MKKQLVRLVTSIFATLAVLIFTAPLAIAASIKPSVRSTVRTPVRPAVKPVTHPLCEYPDDTYHIPGSVPKMKIALTLDDGPNPATTPYVLDILKKYNITATFFLIGGNIPGNEAIVHRELAEGHNIGNHTFTHPHMPKLTPAQAHEEFARTDTLLAQFPKSRPRVARLPYGESSCAVEKVAEQMGYTLVGWNMDSCDWSYGEGLPVTDDCMTPHQNAQFKNDYLGWIDHELARTHGGMFLMHDAEPWTRDHLELVIQHLISQGYEFVTVDDGSFPGLFKTP